MRRVAVALAAASLFAATPANPADTHAVLATARQRVQAADFRASGHLVRVDANGGRTSDAISIKAHWFPGVLRVIVETTPPAGSKTQPGSDARSHILIEMHPDGQTMIKIAHPGDTAPATMPFDKWSDGPLGDGFSYEDFLEQQYFWPGQAIQGEAKYGARDCDILKSTPGAADRTHYAEIKTWLDQGIGFPVYVEKTLKGTGAVKEFTYYGLRRVDGVWSASQVEAKTHGRAGSTLLIIDRGSAKAKLDLGDFSPEQLTRF
jgi:hypothetical protein